MCREDINDPDFDGDTDCLRSDYDLPDLYRLSDEDREALLEELRGIDDAWELEKEAHRPP